MWTRGPLNSAFFHLYDTNFLIVHHFIIIIIHSSKVIVNHKMFFFFVNWCNKRPYYLHIHHHLQLHRGSTMKFDLYIDILILALHHCLYNCDWNQYSRTTVSPSTNVSWLEKGTHLIGEICLWYIFKLFKEL